MIDHRMRTAIRSRRKALGLTQRNLAALCRVSRMTINRAETTGQASREMIEAILKALDGAESRPPVHGNGRPVIDPRIHGFGIRVKAAREAKGWTQGRLAQAVGRSRNNITMIEAGTHTTTLGNLLNLAGALDVEPAYLLGANRPGPAADPEKPPVAVPPDLASLADSERLGWHIVMALIRIRAALPGTIEPFDWYGLYQSLRSFLG